jgi:predicted O-methyltransferase YrrM
VVTIEIDEHFADFAEQWIARSDVGAKVEVVRGAALEVLPRFADQSADAAFLDADKASYPEYLTHCLRIVRPGGLIMVDNALAFGQLLDDDPTGLDVPAVRAFNEIMTKTRGLQSVLVPLGDGLWVGVKKDE